MISTRILRLLASVVVTCTVASTAAGCTLIPDQSASTPSGSGSQSVAPTPTETPAPTPSPTPPQEVKLTLLAAGDVLPHDAVNESATGPAGIDYSPLLAGIDPWVAGADLALCHLEVPVAPPGTQPSGYPTFAAPPELVRDLGEQGWDGCSTASNHAADVGYDGIAATLDALDQAGMGHAGTARDQPESVDAQYYELSRGGRIVTVAHLAAAFGLNGVDPPRGAWSVDLIDTERIVQQAEAARAAGADLVVVSLHDGVEYVTEPTEQQRESARALAESGQVDLVLGHHAHVPQPVEHLPGGPEGDGMWVAYGLGNLLSNQGAECCVPASAVGLLLLADIAAPSDGRARVTGVRWAATTVDLAAGHRLRSTREALAHPESGQLTTAELQERLELARSAAGSSAPEQPTPPTQPGTPPQVLPKTP